MADSSHVRFEETEQVLKDSADIFVQNLTEDTFAVHLGFLQMNHTYEITFKIKDKLGEDLQADPLQNLYVKFLTIIPTEDGEGHEFKIDLHAHKEKLMKEQLVVTDSSNSTKSISLILNARVLGTGKGKPSLLNGIHCTGIKADEESDQSDWQGFD